VNCNALKLFTKKLSPRWYLHKCDALLSFKALISFLYGVILTEKGNVGVAREGEWLLEATSPQTPFSLPWKFVLFIQL
jgi:hypothetical protein